MSLTMIQYTMFYEHKHVVVKVMPHYTRGNV